ncbi:MAG: hypothetical protein Q9195_004844 [Heterodermia aff. obscurata]
MANCSREMSVSEIESRLGKVEVPELSESIWSDPRLKDQQHWFQAAFYLLQEQQRHQEPDYTARQQQTDDIDRVLDRIALLFARLKRQVKKTPKHVTAAGLVQDKTVWYLCITKNDGFDEVDKDFGRELEKWFAGPVNEDRNPNPENEFWQRLLKFWEDRLDFYTKCAKKIDWETKLGDKRMADCRSDVASHFLDTMRTFKQELFDAEWKQVFIRLEQVKNIKWEPGVDISKRHQSAKKSKISDKSEQKMSNESQQYLTDFYDFWGRSQRQEYPPARILDLTDHCSPTESAANTYSKCVYYLDMLGLPVSIWKAMVLFRELKEQKIIRVILVDRPILTASEGQLNKSAVVKALQEWKNQGIIDTERALNVVQASEERTQKIYLHSNQNGQLPRWSRALDTDPASTNRNDFSEEQTRQQLLKLNIKKYRLNGNQCPWRQLSDYPPRGGTFARVYPAYRTNLGGPSASNMALYALKEIKIDSQWKLDGVLRELNIMRNLDHQNILTLKEAFFEMNDARMTYLVTDPWAKQSLQDFFWELLKEDKHERWYEPETLRPWPSVTRQCLDGLEYLHARDLKHKDLKPHNILIHSLDTGHGRLEVRPIIADFNISEDNYRSQGSTQGAGTPEFKAPEQIKNGDKTLSSDIWSLGYCFSLILVLMCGGKNKLHEIWRLIFESQEVTHRGFGRNSNRKLVMDTIQTSPTDSDASTAVVFVEELKALLERMLDVSYRNRPSARNARDFLKELECRVQVLEFDLPNINICIEQGGTVEVLSFGKLDLLPIGTLLKRCSKMVAHV